jgi:L-lactate dehydrogenase complex protein LldG
MTTQGIDAAYVDEFVDRFQQMGGQVYRISSTAEIFSAIDQIISERGNGKCYYTREAIQFAQLLGGEPRQADVPEQTFSKASMYEVEGNTNALDIVKTADIGITTAQFGIAETGCLVEVSYTDSTKLLSSLPRVHIVLLRVANILGKLQELAPLLRNVLSSGDAPTVTLISGPSRTSDIEMKSVLGVHGPHEVHAILTD